MHQYNKYLYEIRFAAQGHTFHNILNTIIAHTGRIQLNRIRISCYEYDFSEQIHQIIHYYNFGGYYFSKILSILTDSYIE